jgi:hypothetical protein
VGGLRPVEFVPSSNAYDNEATAALRYAIVGGVDHSLGYGVAETCGCAHEVVQYVFPSAPSKSRHVLHQERTRMNFVDQTKVLQHQVVASVGVCPPPLH